MDKPRIKISDRQFSHTGENTSFGSGDLRFSPNYFSWYRGSENINDLIVITESQFHVVDSFVEKHKVGLIIESPLSNPHAYEFIRKPENYNKFEYILTFNRELIAINPDKFKYYFFGGCWIYPQDRMIYEKTKNVSTIASKKRDTDGHRLRHSVIEAFRDKIDGIYGNGYQFVENKLEALKDYRFSITIENDPCPDMHSEKLIDCFMTGTIPIYCGGNNVGTYFNDEGIAKFDSMEELSDILEGILTSPDLFYRSRRDAIKENFERAKLYCIPEDEIWKTFLQPTYFKQ